MNEKVESGLEVVAWAHPDYCDVITDSPTRTIEWERRGVSPIPLVRQSDAERALSEQRALTRTAAGFDLTGMLETIKRLEAELQQQHEAHRKTWRQLEQVTWLLREVVSDLPTRRDWLDPVLEARMKAALSQQAEPVEPAPAQDELRKRFDEIEDEVARGKHTAASVFTQMRTAAMYIRPAQTEQQLEQSGLVAVAEINREYIGDLRLIKRTALESMPDRTKLYAALPATPSPATAPSHE
ncbi:hypothetical protein [Stutzerimonas stutzeri]|uniref:hypothetical protein n=1 Tax=Stutzerimonas stutzeri TaxID=316 RepID=UPI00372321E6